MWIEWNNIETGEKKSCRFQSITIPYGIFNILDQFYASQKASKWWASHWAWSIGHVAISHLWETEKHLRWMFWRIWWNGRTSTLRVLWQCVGAFLECERDGDGLSHRWTRQSISSCGSPTTSFSRYEREQERMVFLVHEWHRGRQYNGQSQ